MSNPLKQYDRSSVVTGTEGADVLQATSGGNACLFGRGGNDTLIANSAAAATSPSAATSRLKTLPFRLRTQSAWQFV